MFRFLHKLTANNFLNNNFFLLKHKHPFVISIFFSISISAQKETSYWYFGDGAGLYFNGSTPVSLTDGAINSLEGNSSISDSNGNLLFYTDGVTVWNKKHQIMVNGTGLWGNQDASQSSLIVRQPLSNLYYIFTIDAQAGFLGGYGGIAYSIVDMSSQNGNGAIISKNISLLTPTCEKVTAVHHENGVDIWIMTQQWGTNSKYAWLLKSDGLNTIPVVSAIGLVQNNPINGNGQTHGYMKFSHSGSKVASVISFDGIIELYDFNNNTGVLSNLITLKQIASPYGLEFSPNDSMLYSTTWSSELYQWNLSFSSEQQIEASKNLIYQVPYSPGMSPISGLQLGLDKRIYVAIHGLDSIGVINNPNILGPSCNYVHNALFLKGNRCWSGLPNFVQSLLVKVADDPATSAGNISINPIPFSSSYLISVNNSESQYVIMSLYNDIGQLLSREKVNIINGIYTAIIQLNNYPQAIYFIDVITNNERLTKKVLRQ